MDRVFKALSDPTRRRVLQLLRDRPMTAGELADEFELTKATMSGHFNVLREAGLVDADRELTLCHTGPIMHTVNSFTRKLIKNSFLKISVKIDRNSPLEKQREN